MKPNVYIDYLKWIKLTLQVILGHVNFGGLNFLECRNGDITKEDGQNQT